MRNSDKEIQKRRNQIMLICQREGKVNVNELSELFKVSPLTVRRDLQYWEDNNAMIRNYGGAQLVQSYLDNPKEESANELAKHAIAKFAANQVEEDDIIFINTSSSALLVLKYIKNKRVTVITNNGKALLIDLDPLITIQLTGGEIRIPKEALVGEFALNNLSMVTADKVFLGVSGISVNSGLTSSILAEVAINQMMLKRCSGPTYVLADHTKIGTVHSFQSGQLKDIDVLITDTLADLQTVYDIEERNVKVFKIEPFKTLSTIA